MALAVAVRRSRLLDPRIVLGVLLMALSIVAGVRLLSGAEPDQLVWMAARDLPAGATLQPGDVELVPVTVPDSGAYFPAGQEPAGTLRTRLSAGQLLVPAQLARRAPDTRVVAVPVALERLGTALERGSEVDVWASATHGGDATMVARAVLIDDVARDQDWGNGTATVLLRVPPHHVGAVGSATRSGEVDLVATGAGS